MFDIIIGLLLILSIKYCAWASGVNYCSSCLFLKLLCSVTQMISFLSWNWFRSRIFHPLIHWHMIHHISCNMSFLSQKFKHSCYHEWFCHCWGCFCCYCLGICTHYYSTLLQSQHHNHNLLFLVQEWGLWHPVPRNTTILGFCCVVQECVDRKGLINSFTLCKWHVPRSGNL